MKIEMKVIKELENGVNLTKLDFQYVRFGRLVPVSEDGAWLMIGSSLARTINGGRSWHSVDSIDVPEFSFEAIHATSKMHCVAVGNNVPSQRKDHFLFWMTKDGGKTWKHTPIGTGFVRCYPKQIVFVSEYHGWIVANCYDRNNCIHKVLFRTNDGGGNWEIMGSDFPTTVDQILFLAQNRGFMLYFTEESLEVSPMKSQSSGESGSSYEKEMTFFSHLLSTEDAGSNWKKIYSFHQNIQVIRAFGDHGLYAVGGDGRVLMSQDNGCHWYSCHFKKEECIYDIAISSSGLILAVGDEGALFLSKRGTKEWFQINDKRFESRPFHNVCFFGPNHGVMVHPKELVSFEITG